MKETTMHLLVIIDEAGVQRVEVQEQRQEHRHAVHQPVGEAQRGLSLRVTAVRLARGG